MMNLQKTLKIKNSLPPSNLHELLFSRKLVGNSGQFTTATGYPCVLSNSIAGKSLEYRIFGNSVQDGTPSPENPVEVRSVGELVMNGENQGKYAVPIISISTDGRTKTTTVCLSEPLRKIFTYSDEISENTVIRRTKSIVINGSEKWLLSSSNTSNWVRYPIGLQTDDLITSGSYATAVSDKIRTQNSSENAEKDTLSLRRGGSRIIWFFVPFEMLGNISADDTEKILDAWKQWLSENPVNVQYVLESSETEPIIQPAIAVFGGMTTVTTDTEIPPSNMEITYKLRR